MHEREPESEKFKAAQSSAIHLHSRYNPQAEAARYIDSLALSDEIKCFILIEPGQGYIIPVLKEKFKNTIIIALHVNNSFPKAEIPVNYGTDSSSVQKFLDTHIRGIDTSQIKIIEWRPSLNYFEENYLILLKITAEYLKRMDAEKRTVAVFGKRWVKNFFKNLKLLNNTLLYKNVNVPVIVTGSGPSLEKSIPVIRNMQESCFLFASSSSAMALASAGIIPDMIIAADGGIWALQHIYPLFRDYYTNKNISLAVNLCAALPSQCRDTPFLVMNDGSLWQSIIFHELKIPSVVIPQKGTVTAAALELALLLSCENIYLAGLDLAVSDIRTHARPYGFDHLFDSVSGRFKPVYSQVFSRSLLMKEGGSMDVYAAWFKNELSLLPKRIFSLGESNKIFKAFTPSESESREKRDCFKILRLNDTNDFCGRGLSSLFSALKNSLYSGDLKAELIPLLFPGKSSITDNELETALREAALE